MGLVPKVIPKSYEQIQEVQKEYEAEIALAVKLVLSTASLLAIDIFKMPSAKVVKDYLTLAKSICLLPSGLSSTHELLTLQVNSLNGLVRDLSSAVLIPFTFISLSDSAGYKTFKFLDEVFKASPVLSHLKFAGIPNIAIIGLLASFTFDAYAKQQNELEKTEVKPAELADHKVKIIQNHWSLVEKTVKVASTVFSFAVLAGSYSHPAITVIKITFLLAEMGLAVKKYEAKYVTPVYEYSVVIVPEQE